MAIEGALINNVFRVFVFALPFSTHKPWSILLHQTSSKHVSQQYIVDKEKVQYIPINQTW